jgi:hypothetical protein
LGTIDEAVSETQTSHIIDSQSNIGDESRRDLLQSNDNLRGVNLPEFDIDIRIEGKAGKSMTAEYLRKTTSEDILK